MPNPPSQKNATPNHGKNKTIARLVIDTMVNQEVRRIAIRLARKRIQPAHHRIGHSAQSHQAIARRAHLKAKRQL